MRVQQGEAPIEHQDVPLSAEEAAARLDMTAQQLTAWSERFEWPQPDSAGCYAAREIDVLAQTIEHSVSISSAIARARAESASAKPCPAPARARRSPATVFVRPA
jgi:hypothetical protein